MNKSFRIDKKKLEKYVGEGSFKTVSELEAARERYLKSDLFLKNRKSIRIHPLEIGDPIEKLKLLSEIDLTIKYVLNKLDKDGKIMPEPYFSECKEKYLEAARIFPLPIDVYISHSEACQIFDVTEKVLKLYREIGLLLTLKDEREFTYHWVQLQAYFG